ncbi:MAG: pyridoxamine kinase [Peptococcaceae bacterium]|nr:pyridoxamine kinase [Peptococcaceae bacterium]
MLPLKRVAALHDISGFGKCSLTVALPVLSAAGIETCPVPTAVLSTHTGEFTGFTYRDLTTDLPAYIHHWQTLGLHFDAIYSGFLGSKQQIAILKDFCKKFREENTLVFVDPVMGDNGKLYSVYTPEICAEMKQLAAEADILVPNMTEAAFLLDIPYQPGPYSKDYIQYILTRLLDLGAKTAVLTGVWLEEKHLGAAAMSREEDKTSYAFSPKVSGMFHGTGDVFSSLLLAAILNDCTLEESIHIAVDLTYDAIVITKEIGTAPREGVAFERILPCLINRLHLK